MSKQQNLYVKVSTMKRNIRNQTPLYLNMDSEWKKIKISDMRNKSTI